MVESLSPRAQVATFEEQLKTLSPTVTTPIVSRVAGLPDVFRFEVCSGSLTSSTATILPVKTASLCPPVKMNHRSFRDGDGKQWQVWLVSPRIVDRRKGERRSRQGALSSAGERRRSTDRRVSGLARASVLPASFAAGWLCFESETGEKRRLYPVPENWDELSDEQLSELSRKGREVATRQLV